MDIRSDFHTHTNLSSCAPAETTVQSMLDVMCGRPDGLRAIGISNHLWDSDVPGASDWYKPQNVPHVLQIREQLKNADTHGAVVRVGAEVEFTAECKVAVTYEHAKLFDYLLITANHTHMKGLIIPAAMIGMLLRQQHHLSHRQHYQLEYRLEYWRRLAVDLRQPS